MKKITLFFGGIAMAFCAILFVPKAQSSVSAEVLSDTNICGLQKGVDYELSQDIDCEIISNKFVPVSQYGNTIDGKGHTIKNLTIYAGADVDKAGFLSSTNGAVIKNLKFENLNIVVTHDIDLHVSKVGLLIGEATNTRIENCSFENCRITVSVFLLMDTIPCYGYSTLGLSIHQSIDIGLFRVLWYCI